MWRVKACGTKSQNNSHDCCTPQPKGKVECPQCGAKSKGVLGKTLAYLLTAENFAKLQNHSKIPA